MNKDKRYIITRSNYTLKKKHKSFNDDSVVYERDYMVTNNGNTWSGDGSPYGTSSFKMVSNVKNGGAYKYNSGKWIKTPICNDENNKYGEIWTLNCVPNKDVENVENNIQINLNKNSLLSFAYYGSCKDLIKNSINNIILTFPAELSFTNISSNTINSEETLYKVENPFLIDLHTIVSNRKDENNLRIFTQNYEKYEIIDVNNVKKSIYRCDVINFIKEKCAKENDLLYKTDIFIEGTETPYISIYCYYINKNKEYYTKTYNDIRIRPNEKYVEAFFNNLNFFQKNMLNRFTTPVYTMYLDFPHETEYGIETYKKRFTWPIIENNWGSLINDWNLDINTYRYEEYINELLHLANFYDERCTDNLWRSLTHDSIKNMDYAFKNDKIEDDEYKLGESKFEKIIKCYSMQLDEIKQYADNIKNVNNITYDGNNNAPNSFLKEKLEMNGWEVYNLSNVLNENINFEGKNSKDINTSFMRNLFINSKSILSRKGTRHGIEMLLSLFGLKSYDNNKTNYDYKITEYVDTVVNNQNMDYANVVYFNGLKKTYKQTQSGFEENNTNPLQGIPVREVEYKTENGEITHYLIPWFDKTDKIDGNMYFQMYGGWCKIFTKEIYDSLDISDDIKNTKNIPIYDETIKYLIYVDKIDDLKYIHSEKLYDDCIAYVHNIQNFENIYQNDKNIIITIDGKNKSKIASNYFILKNKKNFYTIGSYDKNNETHYGWVNVTKDEIENNTNNGIKVKLIESIIENHKGNNPHGGFGKYDDGDTYLDYFRKIFKYSIENNNFVDTVYSCENGKMNPLINNIGFEINRQKDNVKTWFFTNTTNENNTKLVELEYVENISEGNVYYNGEMYENVKNVNYYYNKKKQNIVPVGKNNNFTFYESEITPYKFEPNLQNGDENEANSIINNKKLLIEFSNGLFNDSVFPQFLQKCILPYLKQIMPSTTIWEVKLEGDYAVYTNRNFAKVEE